MNKWILIIVGGLVVYYYRVYRAARLLGLGLGVPRKVSFKDGGLSFTIPLKITNGSDTAIPISSVSINNFIGDTEVGYTILPKTAWIAARSRTDVPLSVNIPFASLINAGLTLYNQIKSEEFKLSFKGSVSSLGINIPVNQVIGVNFKGLI